MSDGPYFLCTIKTYREGHFRPAFFAEGKSFGYEGELGDDKVLVSADTVVICDGEIFGKPSSRGQAKVMLHQLSGKTHLVVSSVCVRDSIRYKTLSDTASVKFRVLTDEEIDHYIEKNQSFFLHSTISS